MPPKVRGRMVIMTYNHLSFSKIPPCSVSYGGQREGKNGKATPPYVTKLQLQEVTSI